MRIVVGSDHAGFELKSQIISAVTDLGHEVNDLGTFSSDPVDYPDFARSVGLAVAHGLYDRGILICGTGIGMSMAANKVPGVRAALCHDVNTARLAREHNDANVLVLGSRVTNPGLAGEIAKTWLETAFLGGRHQRRVGKIQLLEREFLRSESPGRTDPAAGEDSRR